MDNQLTLHPSNCFALAALVLPSHLLLLAPGDFSLAALMQLE